MLSCRDGWGWGDWGWGWKIGGRGGGGGVMVLVVVGMLVTNFWRYIYIAWFFVDQEFTFYVWLNCWLNDDQTPGLQLFVQWVMPHSRLNKGPYDFTQDKFWPLGINCCCLCLCLSVCPYVTVCQPWTCPCDNLWPVQARITKYGSEVQNNLVKIPI